ncbi:hypothetical protein Acid7E03_43420 [Acidisoma sp. 7E03]
MPDAEAMNRANIPLAQVNQRFSKRCGWIIGDAPCESVSKQGTTALCTSISWVGMIARVGLHLVSDLVALLQDPDDAKIPGLAREALRRQIVTWNTRWGRMGTDRWGHLARAQGK